MRKFLILLISLVSLLLLGAPVLHAQDATDTPDAGWPVEERCVGAPTKPPKGWSYDGTILMTGYAGIHGVNAKWDTPRVLAKLSDKDVWGGALSPDGKWYASPYGERFTTESLQQRKQMKSDNDIMQIHPVYDSASGGLGKLYSLYCQGIIQVAADTFQESRNT